MTLPEFNDAMLAFMLEHTTHDEADIRCVHCGSGVAQQRVAISIHILEFSGCTGPGEVAWLLVPYCPACEPVPGPGCLHVPLILHRAVAK